MLALSGRLGGVPASLSTWWRRGGWAWLLPFVVAVVVDRGLSALAPASAVLVAAGLVVAVARKPERGLYALVVVLPFQPFLLAYTFKLGAGATLVRDLSYWKELVVAGCVAAAVRHMVRQRRRPDAIDWLGGLYALIVVLYRIFPTVFVQPTGMFRGGPPTNATTLDTALRNDLIFVVLLLAVRHLPLPADFGARFSRAVLTIGIITAALGFFEFFESSAWNHFLVHTIGLSNYDTVVLKARPLNPIDLRVYTNLGGREILRIGSIFVDQLACGFYLVGAFAIALERLTRTMAARLPWAAATALIGLGILLTQTRDAILAGLIVVLWAVRPLAARRRAARRSLGLLLAVGLLVAIPLALATGLVARTFGAVNGQDQSAKTHVTRTTDGIKQMVQSPLGRGLGTGGANGNRFQVTTASTSEDYYLQVANETGVASLIAFGSLTVVLNRRLRKRAVDSSDEFCASWRGAFLGLCVAGLLLQVWSSLVLATTVWLGVGLCLATESPLGPDRRCYDALPRHGKGILYGASSIPRHSF